MFHKKNYRRSIIILIDMGFEYSSIECSEFRLRKLTKEEKLAIILARLEFLIDDALNSKDKQLFYFHSNRYNLIKSKYGHVLNSISTKEIAY